MSASNVDDMVVNGRTDKRSEMARTLGSNGYSGTLVLNRERVISMSTNHLALIIHLEENGPCTVNEIAEAWDMSEDWTVEETVKDVVSSLNKMGITTQEDGEVKLQHDHVVIPLI